MISKEQVWKILWKYLPRTDTGVHRLTLDALLMAMRRWHNEQIQDGRRSMLRLCRLFVESRLALRKVWEHEYPHVLVTQGEPVWKILGEFFDTTYTIYSDDYPDATETVKGITEVVSKEELVNLEYHWNVLVKPPIRVSDSTNTIPVMDGSPGKSYPIHTVAEMENHAWYLLNPPNDSFEYDVEGQASHAILSAERATGPGQYFEALDQLKAATDRILEERKWAYANYNRLTALLKNVAVAKNMVRKVINDEGWVRRTFDRKLPRRAFDYFS